MKVRLRLVTCWTYIFTKRVLSQKYVDPQLQHIENGVCAEGVTQPGKKIFLTDSNFNLHLTPMAS